MNIVPPTWMAKQAFNSLAVNATQTIPAKSTLTVSVCNSAWKIKSMGEVYQGQDAEMHARVHLTTGKWSPFSSFSPFKNVESHSGYSPAQTFPVLNWMKKIHPMSWWFNCIASLFLIWLSPEFVNQVSVICCLLWNADIYPGCWREKIISFQQDNWKSDQIVVNLQIATTNMKLISTDHLELKNHCVSGLVQLHFILQSKIPLHKCPL